jgi:hypothetical protein
MRNNNNLLFLKILIKLKVKFITLPIMLSKILDNIIGNVMICKIINISSNLILNFLKFLFIY